MKNLFLRMLACASMLLISNMYSVDPQEYETAFKELDSAIQKSNVDLAKTELQKIKDFWHDDQEGRRDFKNSIVRVLVTGYSGTDPDKAMTQFLTEQENRINNLRATPTRPAPAPTPVRPIVSPAPVLRPATPARVLPVTPLSSIVPVPAPVIITPPVVPAPAVPIPVTSPVSTPTPAPATPTLAPVRRPATPPRLVPTPAIVPVVLPATPVLPTSLSRPTARLMPAASAPVGIMPAISPEFKITDADIKPANDFISQEKYPEALEILVPIYNKAVATLKNLKTGETILQLNFLKSALELLKGLSTGDVQQNTVKMLEELDSLEAITAVRISGSGAEAKRRAVVTLIGGIPFMPPTPTSMSTSARATTGAVFAVATPMSTSSSITPMSTSSTSFTSAPEEIKRAAADIATLTPAQSAVVLDSRDLPDAEVYSYYEKELGKRSNRGNMRANVGLFDEVVKQNFNDALEILKLAFGDPRLEMHKPGLLKKQMLSEHKLILDKNPEFMKNLIEQINQVNLANGTSFPGLLEGPASVALTATPISTSPTRATALACPVPALATPARRTPSPKRRLSIISPIMRAGTIVDYKKALTEIVERAGALAIEKDVSDEDRIRRANQQFEKGIRIFDEKPFWIASSEENAELALILQNGLRLRSDEEAKKLYKNITDRLEKFYQEMREENARAQEEKRVGEEAVRKAEEKRREDQRIAEERRRQKVERDAHAAQESALLSARSSGDAEKKQLVALADRLVQNNERIVLETSEREEKVKQAMIAIRENNDKLKQQLDNIQTQLVSVQSLEGDALKNAVKTLLENMSK